jgi:restriction system protein
MALRRYSYNVSHNGLGKFRVISGTDELFVKTKAQALVETWNGEYERKLEKEKAKEEQENNRQAAEDLTDEATEALEQVADILHNGLSEDHEVDWENLKCLDSYPKPKPAQPEHLKSPREPQLDDGKPTPPVYLEYPAEPTGKDEILGPPTHEGFCWGRPRSHANWVEEVKRIEAENQRLYDESVAAIERWNSPQRQIEHEQALARWEEAVQEIEAENQRRRNEYTNAMEAWNKEAVEHLQKRDHENAAIDNRKAQYESLVPDAVSDYCELVLSASEYPDSFPKEFELEYISGTKILVVDYSLPAPEHLPRVKEVKYVKAKVDMVEVFLSETELNRIYDCVLYQICLRTIYELFDADVTNALSAVVFNGWVKSIDKATGKEVNGCVISVQTTKEEFQKIELANVDPKACFKTLKGIGSSKLHSLTPIAPILKINREDKRFVASYAVAGQLDERSNLAAMDWEDFEHLIRELFEKEFSNPGCEVRVTQASRDGGVDSVVLDSDPIHGGKTVIQAKRYTNTVGVAAVRELWGTVLNEGAMKGILVTTADYGPDAYEFAKGKPLVLLNGANLLHLLEKHGHKAKIDIPEAKRILGEKAPVFHP